MKNISISQNEYDRIKFYTFQNILVMAMICLTSVSSLQAQEPQYTKPSWWFGAAAGANLNFYRGSTQQMNADFTSPTAFHNGFGAGLFLAPNIEYHKADSRFGFMVQAGYDNRYGKFNQVITPCDCPADLKTKYDPMA